MAEKCEVCEGAGKVCWLNGKPLEHRRPDCPHRPRDLREQLLNTGGDMGPPASQDERTGPGLEGTERLEREVASQDEGEADGVLYHERVIQTPDGPEWTSAPGPDAPPALTPEQIRDGIRSAAALVPEKYAHTIRCCHEGAALIASLQREVAKAYECIGAVGDVVLVPGNWEPSDQIAHNGIVAAITQMDKEVASLRDENARLKELKQCSNCGMWATQMDGWGLLSAASYPCNLCRKADTAEERIAELKAALRELVRLKNHKIAHGKDAHYQCWQPQAWDKARDALAGGKT